MSSALHFENLTCLTMYSANLLFFGTAEIESCMPSSNSSVNVSHYVLKISQKFFFISHFFVATTFLISSLIEREMSKKNMRSSFKAMITNNLHIKTEFTVVPEVKHCD